jgi:hypothetical protein
VDLFAKFSLGLMFVLGSLWSGTLGLLHISNTPADFSVGVKNSDKVAVLNSLGEKTRYSKDSAYVYEIDPGDGKQKVVAKADPLTFRILDRTFSTDGKYVFGANEVLDGPTLLLEDIDPNTFELTAKISNEVSPGEYARDVEHLLYKSFAVDVTPIAGFDMATLEFVPTELGFNQYARDKNGLYVRGHPYSRFQRVTMITSAQAIDLVRVRPELQAFLSTYCPPFGRNLGTVCGVTDENVAPKKGSYLTIGVGTSTEGYQVHLYEKDGNTVMRFGSYMVDWSGKVDVLSQ